MKWEVCERGVDEWFVGKPDGQGGYQPFEEIGHGLQAKDTAAWVVARFNEYEDRLAAVEGEA